MSKVQPPENIWAYDDGAHLMAFDWDNASGGAVKYVRADLVAALEAQLAERPARHIGTIAHVDHGKTSIAAAVARHLSALEATPPAPADDDGSMTPEEIRLENLKQMAAYDGPIVSFEYREPYYLASCDHCGWVGSTELCGTDSSGDDSDVYCPRCSASGADCGKVATSIATPPAPKVTDGKDEPAEVTAITDYWFDHYVADICTLCGNGGVVDTRQAKSPVGVPVGRLNWCICPNGQSMRSQAGGSLPMRAEGMNAAAGASR